MINLQEERYKAAKMSGADGTQILRPVLKVRPLQKGESPLYEDQWPSNPTNEPWTYNTMPAKVQASIDQEILRNYNPTWQIQGCCLDSHSSSLTNPFYSATGSSILASLQNGSYGQGVTATRKTNTAPVGTSGLPLNASIVDALNADTAAGIDSYNDPNTSTDPNINPNLSGSTASSSAASSSSKKWLLIGGGVLAVVVISVLIFHKSK